MAKDNALEVFCFVLFCFVSFCFILFICCYCSWLGFSCCNGLIQMGSFWKWCGRKLGYGYFICPKIWMKRRGLRVRRGQRSDLVWLTCGQEYGTQEKAYWPVSQALVHSAAKFCKKTQFGWVSRRNSCKAQMQTSASPLQPSGLAVGFHQTP